MSRISRRDALRLGLAGAAVPTVLGATAGIGASVAAAAPSAPPPSGTLVGSVVQRGTATPASWMIKPFDNNQVTLYPSLFTANRDLTHQFLLNYPIDNMLYLFRLNAGLPNPPGASAPGAWEIDGGNLRGHYAGHFLSAMALGYAGTANTAFLDRTNYMVTALGQCQAALNALAGQPPQSAPASWVAGKFGNALALNGSSNYVSLPAGIVNGLTNFTIATWVRPSSTSQWSRVFDFGTGTSRYMFLTLNGGSSRPRFSISTGGSGAEQQVNSSQTVSANSWVHVAVTLSGTTASLYLNGTVVGTNANMTLTPSSLANTANNWIGRSQFGDPLLNGAVDNFQLFDRALTAAQIQALTTTVDGGTGGGNVAWYRFDETSGASAADSSGHGRTASVFTGSTTGPGPSHVGYLAAYPETQFIQLESFATYPTVWAPWYTCHMIMRGLLDAYVYAGNNQALEIAKGMGDWAWSRLQKCTRDQLDRMWTIYIAGEYNAMPAALTDLYALTGNRDYFNAAQAFVNTSLFDAAVANQDTINGKHANQHIPQYQGYLTMFDRFDGTVAPTYRGPASQYYTAAVNFWDMVVPHRVYVDGGMAGSGEIFGARDVIASSIQTSNAETCCEYNMLKLSRSLFFHTGDPKYMQYYERALFGQILASHRNTTSNTNPNLTYFIPVNPGATRSYGNLGTCCGGTGLESHEKFQDSIYFTSTDDSQLYVNLYIPSTLNWATRGILIDQSTNYPTDPAGETALTVTGSGQFTLKLRVPYWVQKGFTVKVNGIVQQLTATAGTYVSIARTWNSGDTVDISMPFTLRVERALDQPQTQAIAYGPVPMVTTSTSTNFLNYSFYSSLGLRGDLSHALTPAAPPMTFTANGQTIRPFYIDDATAYHVYFHRSEPNVVFGSVSAGVPNVARSDGLTFLDVVWLGAPFASQADFTRAVQDTSTAFLQAGLITRQQSQALLLAAARAVLAP
jgi:DUF1680 family protein